MPDTYFTPPPFAAGGVVTHTTLTAPNTATIPAPQKPQAMPRFNPYVDKVSMKDLQSEAFNTPIDTLIDLWLTRYGNEWVDMDKIEGDEFYVLAYKRLKSLGQLETHYLTDRARFVCRKPI
jgi:hypothetical protein